MEVVLKRERRAGSTEVKKMGRQTSDGVMRKQLCGIVIGLFILVGGMIGFGIAIIIALPSMNESAGAPVEMNRDMKQMKADGLAWFNANVKNKFASDQVGVTATQIVDLIDKGHGIGVKVNTILNTLPTEVLANGIGAACGIVEKMNVALSKEGSSDLATDVHKILAHGEVWMNAIDIEEIRNGAKAASGILHEVNRLMSEVSSDQFRDTLHRVHSLLEQADTDKIVDHVSQLGEGISKLLEKLNSKEGLTIKL